MGCRPGTGWNYARLALFCVASWLDDENHKYSVWNLACFGLCQVEADGLRGTQRSATHALTGAKSVDCTPQASLSGRQTTRMLVQRAAVGAERKHRTDELSFVVDVAYTFELDVSNSSLGQLDLRGF